jgi:phage baseplate assembly protein V
MRGLITRGLALLVDAAKKVQRLQVEGAAGELRDDVEHLEPYGLTAHPVPGAEVVVLTPGGAPDHAVVVVCGDRRYRLKGLAQGEVALYDDLGQKVHLTRTGIRVQAPLVELASSGASLTAANGVVTGVGVDPFTGQTYAALGAASQTVRASA